MKTLAVQITLPKDRRTAGVLKVYTDTQPELFVAPCLGLGTGLAKVNPLRDPLKRWGNTPGGAYKPTTVIDRGARLTGRPPYGRYVIALVPVDPVVAARRHGLMIHGGRGNDKLMVTRGCVRMLDIDMARLAKICAGAVLVVQVCERASPHNEFNDKFNELLTYLRGLPRDKLRQLLALLK
jgi:hypothetical protein